MSTRTSTPCTVDGCERLQLARGWCSMHYERWRRTGDLRGAAPELGSSGDGYVRKDGYVQDTSHGHPLAGSNGHVLRHRRVLFDAIGFGPHPCVWCGMPVDWEQGAGRGLTPDHLDGDRGNNDLANLAVACHSCNSQRTRKWLGPDGWHGRLTGYTRRKCRCDACRAAYRAYSVTRRRTAA